MSNIGLDINTIQELLKADKTTTKETKAAVNELAKPIQIGPLRYTDTTGACASRGCGSQCMIQINGIRYCSSHALYELNRLLLDAQGVDYSDCTCNAGRHSKMNVHTSDCPVWQRVKEQKESDKSSN